MKRESIAIMSILFFMTKKGGINNGDTQVRKYFQVSNSKIEVLNLDDLEYGIIGIVSRIAPGRWIAYRYGMRFSILPNGDYHFFLARDFTWGILGYPWKKTITSFDSSEVQGSSHVLELGNVRPDNESRRSDLSYSLVAGRIHAVVSLVLFSDPCVGQLPGSPNILPRSLFLSQT
jgi:hypothetical protein